MTFLLKCLVRIFVIILSFQSLETALATRLFSFGYFFQEANARSFSRIRTAFKGASMGFCTHEDCKGIACSGEKMDPSHLPKTVSEDSDRIIFLAALRQALSPLGASLPNESVTRHPAWHSAGALQDLYTKGLEKAGSSLWHRPHSVLPPKQIYNVKIGQTDVVPRSIGKGLQCLPIDGPMSFFCVQRPNMKTISQLYPLFLAHWGGELLISEILAQQ